MGRAVNSKATYEEITDPNYSFEREDCDAWWVHAAASAGATDNDICEAYDPAIVAHFFRFEPYALPLIGWERDNRPRFYKREILIRHAYRFHHLGHSFPQGRQSKDPCSTEASGPAIAN